MEFATYVATHIATCVATEWLAERISWLGERYSDREIHKNGLEKKFSCRSVWIVITSLYSESRMGQAEFFYYKAKV